MSDSKKIYCAGPMFNPSEIAELSNISEHLESIGYSTFLPPRDGLEFIQKGREKGKVLVHCLSGVARSAAIVTAYLMKTNEKNADETIQFLRTKRKVININKGFQEQLRSIS
ncbi:dual specificity protein phosphatase [Leptospira sp. 96542]|nr:dual specificity protein phosphatase [Leptospira sp. 96542]